MHCRNTHVSRQCLERRHKQKLTCIYSTPIPLAMPAGFAAFLELCCGPLYILAKVQLADGVVAVAEAAAIIAKGSLTLYLLKGGTLPVPIALSWAQVGRPYQHALLLAYAC